MSYRENIPDHPVIRNLERTGYPDGKEPEYPRCPACQEPECVEVYVQKDEGVIGCEACITKQDAEDRSDCLNERDEPICPVCEQPCGYIYTDRDGDVLGCDECVTLQDAWGIPDCFPDRECCF